MNAQDVRKEAAKALLHTLYVFRHEAEGGMEVWPDNPRWPARLDEVNRLIELYRTDLMGRPIVDEQVPAGATCKAGHALLEGSPLIYQQAYCAACDGHVYVITADGAKL